MKIVSVAAFVRRHASMVKTWTREQLITWVQWYDECKGLAIVEDKGKIVGIAFARPIEDLKDIQDHYSINLNGPILWVSLVISKDKRIFDIVWRKAIERFGHRKYVGFQRSKYGGKPSLYSFDRMTSKLVKNYG